MLPLPQTDSMLGSNNGLDTSPSPRSCALAPTPLGVSQAVVYSASPLSASGLGAANLLTRGIGSSLILHGQAVARQANWRGLLIKAPKNQTPCGTSACRARSLIPEAFIKTVAAPTVASGSSHQQIRQTSRPSHFSAISRGSMGTKSGPVGVSGFVRALTSTAKEFGRESNPAHPGSSPRQTPNLHRFSHNTERFGLRCGTRMVS